MDHTLPSKNPPYFFIYPAIFLVGLILAFLPVLQKLMFRWDSGDNSYAYAIIPIFLYLCWDIKDKFKFYELSWNFYGLIPFLLSIALAYAGELGSIESLSQIGIWVAIASFAITMYGKRSKHLVFPFLLLAFIVPLPEFINNMLTFKLKLLATSISVEMLRIAGLSVMQDGNIIDLGIDKLQVVDACSGLRYFMSMVVISLLVGYLFVKGWWKRTFLVLLVLPLSSLVNGLRIFLTGLLVMSGQKNYTEGASHDAMGVIVFLVAGALLVMIAFLLKKIGPGIVDSKKTDAGACPVGNLLPIILTGIFLLLLAGGGLALRNIPAVATHPARMTFENFPMQLGQWNGQKQYLDAELVEKGLWSDDYVSATFTKKGIPNAIYLLIPFYAYQATQHTVHAPQACLLGGGWGIIDSGVHSVAVGPNKKINITAMTMNKGDSKLVATHFFLQRGRVLTNPWANKLYLLWDSMTKRRTDGALVRVEMTLGPNQSSEEAFALIDDFVARLWPVLPDYVPN